VRWEFADSALEDVRAIDAYLSPLNRAAMQRVAASIKAAAGVIAEHPQIGRRTPVDDIREFIEPRYRYRLPYIERGGAIIILRVYHPSRAPLDYAAIPRP
jgi:plasmid stabilization system protein ParE